MAPPELQKKSYRAKKKMGVDEKSRKWDLKKRKTTLKNKARQLQILCDVKVCMVCVGSDGDVVTWPENKTEVKSIINEYNRGLLGGKAGAKEKKKLNLSSFFAGNREKLEKKLSKGKELPDEAEKNKAFNEVFSGWQAKLNWLSEGALKGLCNNLDCKLQILREKIMLLQSKENEKAIQVFNGDNLEPTYMYHTECHQQLFPISEFGARECYFNQPIDDGSSNLFLGASTNVFLGEDSTDNFGPNIYNNLLLNYGDNLEPNIYQKECQQPLLPLCLLGECYYSNQLTDVGSSNHLLGSNTSVLLGESSNDFSAATADKSLLLDNYFSYANMGFSVPENFGSIGERFHPFHPMFP